MNQIPRLKRKKMYLVNRDFQLRYAGTAVIVGVISTILSVVLVLYPLYKFEILRIPRFLPWPILILMTVAALANISMIGVLGIFITHRLAGPMYSLVRQFRRVEEGSWVGDIRLRESDDMRYVVRNFNGMMAAIEQRMKSDIEQLTMIEDISKQQDLNCEERMAKIQPLVRDLLGDVSSRLEPLPDSTVN